MNEPIIEMNQEWESLDVDDLMDLDLLDLDDPDITEYDGCDFGDIDYYE